ncbi:MAG: SAVED domain-containing protein [Leptolyngbyaceae cyanobacterium bins.59]|nr:SAVED domain-containing protein [Leptolyngbyaceae cyanobacterium bins.59]
MTDRPPSSPSSKLSNERKPSLIKRTQAAISSLIHDPAAIFNNPFTSAASVVAAIGGLLADQAGFGYVYVLIPFLVLILIGIWREARKTALYQKESIPLPIVINVANPASSDNALNALFHIIEKEERFRGHQHNLEEYLKIVPRDLVFNFRGDIHNHENLKDFLKITRYDLERLKAKTPKNTFLYLAYIGPASVGILVGTMLVNDSVKIFQYNKSSDSYYPVMEIVDRRIKEDVLTYEKFEVEIPEVTQPRVTVAIDVAFHKIRLEEPSIKIYGDVIYLKSRSMGTIQPNEDWAQYCREIFKVLNFAQQRYHEIRFVYSMPIALGVALGIALQNYWNVMLTNYESATGDYQDLIKLNEIRYYF